MGWSRGDGQEVPGGLGGLRAAGRSRPDSLSHLAEMRDSRRLIVVQDREAAGLEAGHGLAVGVGHPDVDRDDLHVDALGEAGRRRLGGGGLRDRA